MASTTRTVSMRLQVALILSAFFIVLTGLIVTVLMVSFSTLQATTEDTVSKSLRQKYDTMIKNEVQTAASALNAVWRERSSDAQGIEACRSLLRAIRYGNNQSGYFWADDYAGTNMVHGSKPELEGINRMDASDVRGNKYIRDIIRQGLLADGGYSDYWFTRDTDKKHEYQKRGYSISVPALKWVIGTGNYIDDIEHELETYRAALTGGFNSTLLNIIIILIIGSVLLLTIIITFLVRIFRHISSMTDIFKEVSYGVSDFTLRLPVFGRSELSEMSRDFNVFMDRLHDIVANFKSDVERIKSRTYKFTSEIGDIEQRNNQLNTRIKSYKDRLAAQNTFVQESLGEAKSEKAKIIIKNNQVLTSEFERLQSDASAVMFALSKYQDFLDDQGKMREDLISEVSKYRI